MTHLEDSVASQVFSCVPEGAEPLIVRDLLKKHTQLLYITSTDEKADLLTQQLSFLAKEARICHLPAWDCLPYDRLSPSADICAARIQTLMGLLEQDCSQPLCLVVSIKSFLQKLPPVETLKNRSLLLKAGGAIDRESLVEHFLSLGYHRTETVREAGEYAVRGDIVDFFPVGYTDPIRLDFFGDDIERLRSFDALTQKTNDVVENVSLYPVSEITLTPQTISCFRQKFRQHFGAVSSLLYEAISQGRKYAGMEHWLPLFFPQTAVLTDYLERPVCLMDHHVESATRDYLTQINDYYQARLQTIPGDKTSLYHPLSPDRLYFSAADLDVFNQSHSCLHLTPFHQANSIDKQGRVGPDFTESRRHGRAFDDLKERIRVWGNTGKKVVLACMTDGSRDRFLHVLQDHNFPPIKTLNSWPVTEVVTILTYPLEKGFEFEGWVVISEQDLLGDRLIRRSKRPKKADQFFTEASQLNVGDLVVHREHGIGRYEGLQAITVDGATHDCLSLLYEGSDKLFLPVENIELITRYGSDDSSAQLDRLGAAGWQNRKSKVKKKILEVADYLIKLAAERSLHRGEIIACSREELEEFCSRFPYAETDDQTKAIEDTLVNLSQGKPMDRLVCGDVGFGKTEVALRAAFATVSSGKQVAVIVPTTLLCRQHYATFSQRFEGFPYSVAQLSRFVSSKEAEKVREGLKEGKINIVVATHGLLSEKIKFSNLGLLIVDEEQHFGVKQKEKLKQLRTDVHVLTLTATPIPRTLQLALTGVREMSLITTPPIDRLAVRTFVMPYDSVTIREAILREHYRGGQVFYVTPRLEDIEKLKEQLTQLVPEVKVGVAHGQMPTAQLEDVMTAFYDRKYNILLSTNIVESGIDIPNANTLILHRSDLFGLAQLYQLRGRIGRSKTQGYAYLTLDPDKVLTANAQRRLELMQTLDTLGAGFTLASHDMDIRGTGNIVGEAQSGHIREIGVELYQQLLQEAILLTRADQEMGSSSSKDWTPQINLGVSVMIPELYVPDLGVRLGLYRRLSDLETSEDVDQFAAEMIDRFGPLPEEVKSLFATIEIKALCRRANIEKLDAGPKGLVISFRDNKIKNPEKLLAYIQKPDLFAKIRPDQKIVFIREWENWQKRLKGTKIICSNLVKIL